MKIIADNSGNKAVKSIEYYEASSEEDPNRINYKVKGMNIEIFLPKNPHKQLKKDFADIASNFVKEGIDFNFISK